MNTSPLQRLAAALLCAGAVAGCGPHQPRTTPVAGTVAYRGQPVTAGFVVLTSEDGLQTSTGSLNKAGEYEVNNAPVGKVKVVVQTAMFKGFPGAKDMTGGRPPSGNKPGSFAGVSSNVPGPYRAIPAKYESPATSDYFVTVAEGQQRLDLELK